MYSTRAVLMGANPDQLKVLDQMVAARDGAAVSAAGNGSAFVGFSTRQRSSK